MRYDGIDEGHLNRTERLGPAYCRLNSFEWDPILGEKPDGFDNLPNYTEKRRLPLFKRKPSKCDFVAPAIMAIKSIIGEANTSRYWWRFELHKSDEEWFHWYVSTQGPLSEKE